MTMACPAAGHSSWGHSGDPWWAGCCHIHQGDKWVPQWAGRFGQRWNNLVEWPILEKRHQEVLKIFHFHQFQMSQNKKGEEKMKGIKMTSGLNFWPHWETISSCFHHVLDSTHDLNDEGRHIPLANFWGMQLSWEPLSGRWLMFLCDAYKIGFTIKVFSSIRRLNQITRHLNVE